VVIEAATPEAPRGKVAVGGTQRLKSIRKSGVAVTYSCRAACDVKATLTIPAKAARKLHIKPTLASAAASNGGPVSATLKLKPSAATMKRLNRAKRVDATLDVTLSNAAVAETFSDDVAIRR
jgi:hypothetical protein